MHDRTAKDIAFALLFLPGELYMWLKLGHFIRSWAKFLGRRDVDNWGAQAAAERGKGDNAYLQPLAYLAVTFTVLVLTWLALPLLVKEIALCSPGPRSRSSRQSRPSRWPCG